MNEAHNIPENSFVIAVTGHRDLRPQDLEALRLEAKTVLAGIRNGMPEAHLLVLSGLAEGADQLVSEVAVEEGLALAAALPMPLDIYRVQMSEEAQEKLDKLLALSKVTIDLPLEGRTPEQIGTSDEARAACYEALALFLARHGEVLIALWDGRFSDKPGGTYRVVQYARFGSLPASTERVESHCDIVFQVVTPRLSGDVADDNIKTVTLSCAPHNVTAVDGTSGSD